MTLSIADRFSKAQKIRVLPAVGKDPESQRLERIKVQVISGSHHTLINNCRVYMYVWRLLGGGHLPQSYAGS